MGLSVLVDQDAAKEQEVLEVLSSFVTRESSENVLRESLAGLWRTSDCSLLREALSVVAEFEPGDDGSDVLRAELRALLSFRFSSDRSLERPAPRVGGAVQTGSGSLSAPTFHVRH